MGFNGSGALQYGASGAAVGTMIAPGVGTAIGAGAGILAGGLMPEGEKPWYDESWFTDRNNSINDFEGQLAAARSSYLTSLGNMYNNAYSRFSANVEPGFVAKGLSVSGGAFASTLARTTADMQFQGDLQAANMTRSDLDTVEKYRAQLFGQRVSAKTGANAMSVANDQANSQALGKFTGDVGMAYYRNKLDNPTPTNYTTMNSGFSGSGTNTGINWSSYRNPSMNKLDLRGEGF